MDEYSLDTRAVRRAFDRASERYRAHSIVQAEITGVFLWQGFVEAVTSPIQMVNSSKSLLTKVNFRRESLILAGFIDVLFSFLIKIILLSIVFAVLGFVPPWTIVLFPVGVVAIAIVGISIGLLLTPLSMLYGDVQRAVMIVNQFWMFLTPVIYPMKEDGLVGFINRINPATYVIVTAREWIASGKATFLNEFALVVFCAALLFLFGLIIFRVAMPHLIARLGS